MKTQTKVIITGAGIVALVALIFYFSLFFQKTSVPSAFNFTQMIAFNYTAQPGITKEDALNALMNANNDIQEMTRFNLSTYRVNDTFLMAERYYIGTDISPIIEDIRTMDEGVQKELVKTLVNVFDNTPDNEKVVLNYTASIMYSELVSFRKQQAYTIIDAIPVLKERELAFQKNKINTSEADTFISMAITDFMDERYGDSITDLIDAETSLEQASSEIQRLKSLAEISKVFIVRYWPEVLLALIALGIIARYYAAELRKQLAQNKVASSKAEIKVLENLLIRAQKDYFEKKNITMETYKIREENYNQKIAEIKEKLPVYQAIARGVKPPKQKKMQEEKGPKGILKVK